MKKAKLAASLIAVSMAATTLLTGCNNNPGESNTNSNTSSGSNTNSGETNSTPEAPKLVYAPGTELRMATGYNSPKTGISFTDPDIIKSGLTLADGKDYKPNDLKPTWQELEKRLNVKFKDVYKGKKASEEFTDWLSSKTLGQVDMVSGTASDLTANGDVLIDLNQYLDKMPNFKKYLEDNPIVRLSITGSTLGSNKGAIYFSPYFDGVDDIERMPIMRTDWVEKLLNGTDEFKAEKFGTTATPKYNKYITADKYTIDVVKADGSGTETITKDFSKAGGNIIDIMNAKGQMSGVEAVNTLRKYIDDAYGGYYKPENRADLFIGQNAAWDADELVALLRCVVANAQTLNGTDDIQGIFSRNDDNTQRKVDTVRFVGVLFGVRGLESRQDYLYFDSTGALHDARSEADTYEALDRMNKLAQEGLISSTYLNNEKVNASQMCENDMGFMMYDYSQTQTVYNDTVMQDGEEFRPVMVPVACWKDGSDAKGVYMRFTESWRSVKTDGWAISKEGVGNDENKLNACLALIDYAYSKEGQILMSYGPDEFIKTNADGSYVYFNFNGEQWPEISDKNREQLWDKNIGKGSYTDYARFYIGSTLSFLKSQAFEYQCTTEAGRKGAGYISNAIALGTIKHPLLAVNDSNMWYTSIPTVFPTDDSQAATLKGFTNLGKTNFGTSNGDNNIFVNVIIKGVSGTGVANDVASLVAKVKANKDADGWDGDAYLTVKEEQWGDILGFYRG